MLIATCIIVQDVCYLSICLRPILEEVSEVGRLRYPFISPASIASKCLFIKKQDINTAIIFHVDLFEVGADNFIISEFFAHCTSECAVYMMILLHERYLHVFIGDLSRQQRKS